ncbi:20607_t:CDS:2, partial [Funneliformis geosporum]
HVLRGEEHLSNTGKQLVLYEALGWKPPLFGHISIILNQERKKLSKRDKETSWHPGTTQEIFNLSEAIKEFKLEGLHVRGAVYELEKLNWYNNYYIQKLEGSEFAEGIIIGSDSQKVEIYSDKVRDEKKGKGVIANRIDEVDSRSELHQLFPEAHSALFSKKNGEKIESLDHSTYKRVKEVDGEYELVRYLVAKNFHHLKQIIRSYISENETKIYNSAN